MSKHCNIAVNNFQANKPIPYSQVLIVIEHVLTGPSVMLNLVLHKAGDVFDS